MSDINKIIKKRYNRVSKVYDWMDTMIKHEWWKELLKTVSGNVLEVGIGTGANLSFYPEGITITGIDFSKGMLNQAVKKLEKLSLKNNVHLNEMDAEQLEFLDNSFDFVVATCVYCSVPDPVKGLKEMRRVCKPEGKIVMLEHMRSEHPIIGQLMDLLNPAVVKLWGANINRRTLDNIKKAGLIIEENEDLMGTIMRRLVLTPNK